MGYGLLKKEDVEIGRMYIIPKEVGANPSVLLVTKVMLKYDDRFVYQTLDGKIQSADFYDGPKGILLKETEGKLDFLMGRSLLEQMVRAKSTE